MLTMAKRALSNLSRLGSVLLVGFGLCACSGGDGDPGRSAGASLMMEVLDASSLPEALAPAPGEKAVLVNFWATWCSPCVAEMPELEELAAEWKPKGVRVQTVALDVILPMGDVKTAKGIETFARDKGFDLPVIDYTGDAEMLQERYKLGSSLPLTIVIDVDGEIVARRPGAGNQGIFSRMIKKAVE